MSYRRAHALDVLVDELNAAAPDRSTASDGWIGDAAHASRSSDHNPWVKDHRGVGVVRAQDITHDPAGGLNADELATALAEQLGVHPALGPGAYLIWDRRIISADRRGEGWRSYTGSNPHQHHLHVSVALDRAGYDSPQPWNVMEDPMANYADHFDQIETRLERIENALHKKVGRTNTRLARANTLLRGLRDRDTVTGADLDALAAEITAALEDDADPR